MIDLQGSMGIVLELNPDFPLLGLKVNSRIQTITFCAILAAFCQLQGYMGQAICNRF